MWYIGMSDVQLRINFPDVEESAATYRKERRIPVSLFQDYGQFQHSRLAGYVNGPTSSASSIGPSYLLRTAACRPLSN